MLEKVYDYKAGNQYVDWSVKINEGHYDMSAVADPVITDQLPSYLIMSVVNYIKLQK